MKRLDRNPSQGPHVWRSIFSSQGQQHQMLIIRIWHLIHTNVCEKGDVHPPPSMCTLPSNQPCHWLSTWRPKKVENVPSLQLGSLAAFLVLRLGTANLPINPVFSSPPHDVPCFYMHGFMPAVGRGPLVQGPDKWSPGAL